MIHIVFVCLGQVLLVPALVEFRLFLGHFAPAVVTSGGRSGAGATGVVNELGPVPPPRG